MGDYEFPQIPRCLFLGRCQINQPQDVKFIERDSFLEMVVDGAEKVRANVGERSQDGVLGFWGELAVLTQPVRTQTVPGLIPFEQMGHNGTGGDSERGRDLLYRLPLIQQLHYLDRPGGHFCFRAFLGGWSRTSVGVNPLLLAIRLNDRQKGGPISLLFVPANAINPQEIVTILR